MTIKQAKTTSNFTAKVLLYNALHKLRSHRIETPASYVKTLKICSISRPKSVNLVLMVQVFQMKRNNVWKCFISPILILKVKRWWLVRQIMEFQSSNRMKRKTRLIILIKIAMKLSHMGLLMGVRNVPYLRSTLISRTKSALLWRKVSILKG